MKQLYIPCYEVIQIYYMEKSVKQYLLHATTCLKNKQVYVSFYVFK